jgi:hypothetical protein
MISGDENKIHKYKKKVQPQIQNMKAVPKVSYNQAQHAANVNEWKSFNNSC